MLVMKSSWNGEYLIGRSYLLDKLMDDPDMVEIVIADNDEVQLIHRGTKDE